MIRLAGLVFHQRIGAYYKKRFFWGVGTVLLFLSLMPVFVWGQTKQLGAKCTDLDPNTGLIKETAPAFAIGCRCNYFDTTTDGTTVKVKCPSDKYVCTTNDFNASGSNICLWRIGQPCALGDLPAATPKSAVCEGGAICDKASDTCVVDTGDTTLSGALGSTTSDLRDTVRRFINIGLGFLGVLTVLMVIYGGYMWLTAAGNEESVEKGKQILLWAIIGAIVISIAWTISSYVLQVGRTVG